jgi:hypothetical protein
MAVRVLGDMEKDPSDGEQSSHRAGRGRREPERRGTLALSDDEGYVGETVTVKGRNFPGNERFDVVWGSVQGEWGVLEAHEVVGTQFRPREDTVATVEADADGSFDYEWTIPEDYGGAHDIEVRDGEGETLAAAELEVLPWFELKQQTAQLGESFTLRGYGLGPGVMRNNYQVSWDNGNIGFMTGVMNRGTATAEIRAVETGEHVLQVWRNYRGIPYLLNNTQSPFGSVGSGRQNVWTVEVTEPDEPPRTAWMDSLFDEQPIELHYPPLDEDTAADLSVTPQCGQPGTEATVAGTDFPPNTRVNLVWYRHEGHEPRGTDDTPSTKISARPKPDVLPVVETDAAGAFSVDVEIPRDVGSTRPITAEVRGKEVAVTGFMLQPKIERFEPTSGPVGTPIEIELSGVGWTNYENAPILVYDNDPLGYFCGTGGDDETGTVNPIIRAAGDPGYHCIDIYPALFWVEEDLPDFELKPHLSYLDNHPVRPLPAVHFTFEVTDG